MGNTSSQLVPPDQSQQEDKTALRPQKAGGSGAHFSPLPPREQTRSATDPESKAQDIFANGLTPPATFEKIFSQEEVDIDDREGDIDDGASHPSLDRDSNNETEEEQVPADIPDHEGSQDDFNAPDDDFEQPIDSISELVRPPSPRVVILRSPLRPSHKHDRAMSYDSVDGSQPSLVSSSMLSAAAKNKLTPAERAARLERKKKRAEKRARKESRNLHRVTSAKRRNAAGSDSSGEDTDQEGGAGSQLRSEVNGTNGLSPPIELSQSPAVRAAKKGSAKRAREEEVQESPAKRQKQTQVNGRQKGKGFTAINAENMTQRSIEASPLSSDALGSSPEVRSAPAAAKGKGKAPARGGNKSAQATPGTAKGKGAASAKGKAQRRMTDFSTEAGRLGAMLSSPSKGPSGPEKTGPFSKDEIEAVDSAVQSYTEAHDLSKEQVDAWYQVGNTERQKKANLTRHVTEALGNRSRKSVRQFMNRHMCKALRGPWQSEEDKQLRELYEERPKNWTFIAQALGRMPEDCRDRWRDNTGVTERSMGHWKPEETARFLDILKRKVADLRQGVYKDRDDMDDIDVEDHLNWGEVSNEMGAKRSRLQCREKWVKVRRKEQRLAGVPRDLIRPKGPNKGAYKSVKNGDRPSKRKEKSKAAPGEGETPTKAVQKRMTAAQRLNGKFKSAERVVEESESESESESGSGSESESEHATTTNVAVTMDDAADDGSDTSSVDAYFRGAGAQEKPAPTSKSTSASGSTSASDGDVAMPDAAQEEAEEESEDEPAADGEEEEEEEVSESESEAPPNNAQGLRTPASSSSIISSSPEAVQDSQPAPAPRGANLRSPELGSPAKPAAKGGVKGKAGVFKGVVSGEVEDVEETSSGSGSDGEDEEGSASGSRSESGSESESQSGSQSGSDEEEEEEEGSESGSDSGSESGADGEVSAAAAASVSKSSSGSSEESTSSGSGEGSGSEEDAVDEVQESGSEESGSGSGSGSDDDETDSE